MRRLLLAPAVLGLAGIISTANADPTMTASVPINTLSNMVIWSAATGGAQAGTDQLALPFNPIITSANQIASGPAASAINFNLQGPSLGAQSLVPNFLSMDTPALTTNPCTSSVCQNSILSTLGFTHATLFELTFTAPTGTNVTADNLTVTHDDGAALFLAGTDGTTPGMCSGDTTATCSTDLFPVADASPTFDTPPNGVSTANGLMPGMTYDLWYMSANGDPEVLTTDNVEIITTTVLPEPASLALLGSALFGFGIIRRRRNRV